MLDDYLGLGALLQDYLQASLPDIPVMQLADLGEIGRVPMRALLVCICPAGESVIAGGSPDTVTIVQRWLTVLSVQVAARVADGGLARAKAGPLLMQLTRLVQGQQFPGYKPLCRTATPPPVMEDGFAHFPLAWETSFTIVGDGNLL